jgi:hypothetical protein
MGWSLIHSSAIGSSHIESGLPCQDFHAFRQIVGEQFDCLVVAVADGAGSAKFALEGATLACRNFIDQVEAHFHEGSLFEELNREFAFDWLEYFQQRALALAGANETDVREFACTFLGCVITVDKAIFLQVGDGGSVYTPVTNTDDYLWAVEPVESEYANTTDFLTSPDAAEKLRIVNLPIAIDKVAMFTDGVQGLAVDYKNIDGSRPHAPFFGPMFAAFQNAGDHNELNGKLDTFLTSDAVNERTDDDKTLILIKRDQEDQQIDATLF